jgi:hypothetical protein
MNIVFIFHYCSPKINDIASVPIWLGKKENRVLVISARHNNSLKGKVWAPRIEHIGNTIFYRPFKHAKNLKNWLGQNWREVCNELVRFRPDVIIQFGEANFRLPLVIARKFNIPLILFVEYLRLNKFALPFRGKGLIGKIWPSGNIWMTKVFRKWLMLKSSSVMFSYYGDCALIPEVERFCPIVRYVPWCTETEENCGKKKRNRNVGIYIGSLEAF